MANKLGYSFRTVYFSDYEQYQQFSTIPYFPGDELMIGISKIWEKIFIEDSFVGYFQTYLTTYIYTPHA